MRIKNYLLVLLLLSGVFSALAQDYDVKWRTLRNCTYNPSTNLVTKSGTNNWCSAEGLSCNYLLGGEDGYLDYRITGTSSTHQCFIGFNTYNDDNCAVIQYSFHQQGANYKVYENYVSKYTHNSLLQVGDTVRIERSGSNVYYWHIRNGTHTLKYTSTASVDPNDTLYVDFALYYNNSSLGISTASFGYMKKSVVVEHIDYLNDSCVGDIDLTVDSAAGPLIYEWSNGLFSEDLHGLLADSYLVLLTDTLDGVDSLVVDVRHMVKWDTIVSLSYNSVTNTLTNNSGNSWLHGALSLNKLHSNEDGYAGLNISTLALNIDQFVGLSTYNTGAHFNTIDYAIYHTGQTVVIYESGTNVYGAGACEIGDFYYVERSGSNIYYKRIRDGETTLLYTSASSVDPSDELYVDCSIYYNGYSVSNVQASFWGAGDDPCQGAFLLDFETWQPSVDLQVSYDNVLKDFDTSIVIMDYLLSGDLDTMHLYFLGSTSTENLDISFVIDSSGNVVEYLFFENSTGNWELAETDSIFFKELLDNHGVEFFDQVIDEDFYNHKQLGFNLYENILLTPDNDGYNDSLFIEQIQTLTFSTYSLVVKDLDGATIFSSTNPNEKWDGKNGEGQLVAIGTYRCQATLDSVNMEFKFIVEY